MIKKQISHTKKLLKKRFNAGFSVMETLIWVGIVAIFSGVVGFGGARFMDRAKVRAANQELNVYKAALLEYYETEGDFPNEEEGLMKLIEEGYVQFKSSDKNKVVDPWKQPYVYTLIDDGLGFTIVSYGSDKKPGGTSSSKKDLKVSSGEEEDDIGDDTDL